MAKTRSWFVIGGFVVFTASIAWFVKLQPAQTPAQLLALKKDSFSREQLDLAAAICKNAAMNVLKSPSTAQFHEEDVYSKDLGRGRSEIQLEVDAQNSFGAMMRTTIDCKTGWVKGHTVVTSINSRQR